MIPSAVTDGTVSDAERKVFAALARTSPSQRVAALHSLNLSRHDYKRQGEIDFLVLSQSHALVLEVKGGRISRDHAGIWVYTDRFGEDHRRSDGPFKQASTAMFSLQKTLEGKFGSLLEKKLIYGYGVVFPDVEFGIESVEWEPAMVIDARSFAEGLDLVEPLGRLSTHWEWAAGGASTGIDRQTFDEVVGFLRPQFDLIPSLRTVVRSVDHALERLTDEQYQVLDLTSEIQRLIVKGGAGTGKTFLAVECARRHAATGSSVAYVCASPKLAAFVRSRIDSPDVHVVTPTEHCPRHVDVLVVDEAQDVMNADDLGSLDSLLSGGLAEGQWRMFLDPNAQHSLVGRFETKALERLMDFGAVSVPLSRNCRNTPQIVSATQQHTGADLGVAIAGWGPEVHWVDVPVDRSESAVLDGVLSDLLEEGITPGEITVLSASGAELPPAIATSNRLARRGSKRVDASAAGSWPSAQLTWDRVVDFKGLENSVVVLTDLESLAPSSVGINALYVAMSRARAQLVVLVTARGRATLETIRPQAQRAARGEA